jgi:hypothetical protein
MESAAESVYDTPALLRVARREMDTHAGGIGAVGACEQARIRCVRQESAVRERVAARDERDEFYGECIYRRVKGKRGLRWGVRGVHRR